MTSAGLSIRRRVPQRSCKQRSLLLRCSMVALLLVVPRSAAQPTDPPNRLAPRPHIVFVLADDLGWNDIGYHNGRIETPQLDALADCGVRLERYYTLPTCTASRAALLTGRHPIRYGLEGGISRTGHDDDGSSSLPLEEITLAEQLQRCGYRTALCGKWHLGYATYRHRPLQRGFDHQYGTYFGKINHYTKRSRVDHAPDWRRDGESIPWEGYATTQIADEAIRLISEGDPATPLFLLVSFTVPHVPLEVPDEYLAHIRGRPRDRQTYAAMVRCLDYETGRIVTALRQHGYWDQTLFVFTSDNGAAEYESGSNRPLRGGKRSLYEGGVRVPAFVVWPGQLAEHHATANAHVLDWFPTLLRVAGGKPARPLDGVDLLPVLRGQDTNRNYIVLNDSMRAAALLQNQWKLIITRRLRTADAPLEQPLVELFDLKADRRERSNLATQHPDLVKQLREQLEQTVRDWRSQP